VSVKEPSRDSREPPERRDELIGHGDGSSRCPIVSRLPFPSG